MQKEEFILIATRVSEGLASRQEKELFLFHVNTFIAENPEWETLSAAVRDGIKSRLRSNIALEIKGDQHASFVYEEKVVRLWPRFAVAAAIVLAVFGAGLFYFNLNSDKQQADQVAMKNDVAPGKQGATLTLANGIKIHLSDASKGQIAKEVGVTITKTDNGELVYEILKQVQDDESSHKNKINTLSTAKGETYQVRLPDGSLVWLNAASSLTYSATLRERGLRRVKLEGEGYFEIAKDKEHPFIVETKKQEVKVLGTHFNVNSYSDEPSTKTTLLEGSIQINSRNTLKPGQQALTDQNEKTTILQANVSESIAWKNGKFIFADEDIESIMRKLARWYNVEVVYQGDFSGKTFDGSISRSDTISKILDKIAFTQAIHYKIEGRRIYIMP